MPDRPQPGGELEVRFVPARWLVMGLGVTRLLLRKGKFGKLGLAALVWSVLPRTLKITAAAVAFGGFVVLMGAVAAIALLALQLS
jgi:hypothetical protein